MTPDSGTICSSDLQGTPSLRIIETLLPKHPITERLPVAAYTVAPGLRGGKSFPAETPAAPTQPLTGSGAHSLLQLGIHGRLRGIGGCPFLSVLGSSCSGVLVFFFFFFYIQPMRHCFSSSKGTDFLKGILSGPAKLLGSRHPHQQ